MNKKTISAFLTGFMICGCFFNTAAKCPCDEKITFSDISGHWCEDAVYNLSELELIYGYEDGTFKPDENINVDEFIKMILSAKEIFIESGLDNEEWNRPYIEKALKLGIISENEFSDFSVPVTRQQMAGMIAEAYGKNIIVDYESYISRLKDYSEIDDEYKNDVLFVYSQGIMNGYDDVFNPLDFSTRAEATVIISRLIDLKNNGIFTNSVSTQGNALLLNSEAEISLMSVAGTAVKTEFEDYDSENPSTSPGAVDAINVREVKSSYSYFGDNTRLCRIKEGADSYVTYDASDLDSIVVQGCLKEGVEKGPEFYVSTDGLVFTEAESKSEYIGITSTNYTVYDYTVLLSRKYKFVKIVLKDNPESDRNNIQLNMVRFNRVVEKTDTYTIGVYSAVDFLPEEKALINMLNENGFAARHISSDNAGNSEVLNAESLDCIVLLNRVETAGPKKTVFLNYLKNGGDLVVGGSDMFDKFNNNNLRLPIYEGFSYEPYNLEGTKRLVKVNGQDIFTSAASLSGIYSGTSAVGFLFPDNSVYIPVIEARNGAGKVLGNAAGVLTNYAGIYNGGNWLIYGIAQQSFYGLDYFRNATRDVLNVFRSGKLSAKYSYDKIIQENRNKLSSYQITQPKPSGIKLSEDKTHFVDANGKKIFMVAANTFGPAEYLLGQGKENAGTFSVDKIDNLFKMAKNAGVNCLRFWHLPYKGKAVDVIKDMARKYGVYIYIHIGIDADPKKDLQKVENYARAYGDEPMVIGYDLQNEPQLVHIATRIPDEENPLIKYNVYEKCKTYMEKYKASYEWLDTSPENTEYNTWEDYMSEELRRQTIATHIMYKKELFDTSAGEGLPYEKFYSSFDEGQQVAYDAINSLIVKWIDSRREIIKTYDPDALITIGYFNKLNLFQANEKLDFQNYHSYIKPVSNETVVDELRVLDLLKEKFPNTAIMYGEFAYSQGRVFDNIGIQDYHSGSATEFLHWLYAYSKGYSGGAIWCLQEWNPANYRFDNLQYGEWEPIDGLRRERQGIYYYDGNLNTKYGLKPVGMALAFFESYAKSHEPGSGNLQITTADNQQNTGFVFADDNVEYIANTYYDSHRLKFNSDTTPIVMLEWNGTAIKIMATEDVVVSIKPDSYVPLVNTTKVVVKGKCYSYEKNGEFINISLVAGETVEITNFKEAFICK